MVTGEPGASVALEAIQFAGSDDARLFFSGPPQGLSGNIPLVN